MTLPLSQCDDLPSGGQFQDHQHVVAGAAAATVSTRVEVCPGAVLTSSVVSPLLYA